MDKRTQLVKDIVVGKMKNLMIEEEFDNANLEDLFSESHYWMLVDNVANLVVDTKSTAILDDIASRVRDLYLKGEWVAKRKKGV
jgi:hypothetical protein